MSRNKIFIASLIAGFAFPAAASASCGTIQGSFSVTCEQGVQVYRHNSLSGVPAPLSAAEASLEGERIRAKTARENLAAQQRDSARNARLREREQALDLYQTRIYDNLTRRRSFTRNRFGAYGTYGARGYSFGTPVRVRSGSVNRNY